jgi:hypothetical protein
MRQGDSLCRTDENETLTLLQTKTMNIESPVSPVGQIRFSERNLGKWANTGNVYVVLIEKK